MRTNPLAEDYAPSPSDEELVRLAAGGDADALETLLRRHQPYVYNITLRMLQRREDAQDATQEVLLKIATRLASFRGESAFRTWAYRIAANHVLDARRSRPEEAVHGFECYADYLEKAPDLDLASDPATNLETRLLVEETRLGCMMGLLLCLDREQRLIFVLGEIFEISDSLGGEILGLSRDNFRQRLSRARHQLSSFMRGRCGLVDARNPCRCARKTRAFIKDGVVDPHDLQFAGAHLATMREMSRKNVESFQTVIKDGSATLYQAHPFFESPDLVTRLRTLISGQDFRALLNLKD